MVMNYMSAWEMLSGGQPIIITYDRLSYPEREKVEVRGKLHAVMVSVFAIRDVHWIQQMDVKEIDAFQHFFMHVTLSHVHIMFCIYHNLGRSPLMDS